MTNLLITDFRRVLKDKLFLITTIIAAVFAVMMPVLYAALFNGLDETLVAMAGVSVSAKSQFFTAFHFADNFGLVAPVLLAIILCKDFSQGTIRNKIIGGYSRGQIYCSMLVTCAVSLFAMMLFHALLTLGCSLIFFPYQEGGFGWSDFGYLMASLGLELLCYLFLSALLCWLCTSLKNVGIAIVIYVAVAFIMSLVVSALQIATSLITNESLVKVLEVLNQINVFYQVGTIGQGETYTLEQLLYAVGSAIVPAAGLVALGLAQFKKKDIR